MKGKGKERRGLESLGEEKVTSNTAALYLARFYGEDQLPLSPDPCAGGRLQFKSLQPATA